MARCVLLVSVGSAEYSFFVEALHHYLHYLQTDGELNPQGMEIAGIPAMGAAVEKEKFLNSSRAWALPEMEFDMRGE